MAKQLIIKSYDTTEYKCQLTDEQANDIINQLENEQAAHDYQSQLYSDNLWQEADLNERY